MNTKTIIVTVAIVVLVYFASSTQAFIQENYSALDTHQDWLNSLSNYIGFDLGPMIPFIPQDVQRRARALLVSTGKALESESILKVHMTQIRNRSGSISECAIQLLKQGDS